MPKNDINSSILYHSLNFYIMNTVYTIRALAHPSSTLLSLLIDGKTGESCFFATNLKTRRSVEIPLTPIATEKILTELDEKCAYSSEGRVLITTMVSPTTKTFINACWNELKTLKPEFCIK